jgi:hypothetical protein
MVLPSKSIRLPAETINKNRLNHNPINPA